MDYKSIAKKIIDLKNADLVLRDKLVKSGQLSEGYNEEMKELHNRNAKILNDIIDTIGYPTIDKVGKEANEATWLVIQHSIGQPVFMKKCAKLLESAVSENKADPKYLAYLTDRIAVFEGKPQLYGTQFDWDEYGNLSPNLFDHITKVNERRKAIGLNTLEEQTEIIRKQAKNENQSPPPDFEKRKKEIEEWKKNGRLDKMKQQIKIDVFELSAIISGLNFPVLNYNDIATYFFSFFFLPSHIIKPVIGSVEAKRQTKKARIFVG